MTFQRIKQAFMNVIILQYNTNQPVAALVDDAFERFLQLHARVGGHVEQFIAQPLVDQFVERLAENIGIPNLFRVFLKLFEQVFDKLFGLALAADNGRDPRFEYWL